MALVWWTEGKIRDRSMADHVQHELSKEVYTETRPSACYPHQTDHFTNERRAILLYGDSATETC